MKSRAESLTTSRDGYLVSYAIRGVACAILAVTVLVSGRASAQLLVDANNSAIGASSSVPDAAHFQNSSPNVFSSVYVGYNAANGIGYMDNTSDLTTNGVIDYGDYSIVGNWGLGVGEFAGGEGYFVNSGAGTVSAINIRVGDAFGLGSAHGEFYQQSSGTVYAPDYITVGNAGGTGKFVQSGAGAVNTDYEFYVGSFGATSVGEYSITNPAASVLARASIRVGYGGGSGTFTQQNGSVNVGDVGAEDTAPYYQELYVGHAPGTTGNYDLQAGTLTVNGWSNLGRDGGTAIFDNQGTFVTTRELRVGADYSGGSVLGGTATLNNLAGGVVRAGSLYIGEGGANAVGTLNMDGGTISTEGWISIGRYGSGTMVQDGGEIIVNTNNDGFSAFGTGEVAGASGSFTQNHGSVTVINDWYVSGVEGTGTAEILNDSTVTAAVLAAGQYATSDGTITVNNPGGSVNLTLIDFPSFPVIVPVPLTGWVYAGLDPGSTGEINLVAGSITNGDWTEIGLSGNGTLNVSGGTMSTGDNFSIGSNAGGVGLVEHSAGTITVEGNDPAYTGNFIVGRYGDGTYNLSGTGILNLTVGNTGSNNSLSYAVAQADLLLARDGNLSVGEREGTGHLNQSGGTINVGANVTVGGADFGSGIAGTGVLTMTGGTINVGLTSPTGGDLVLGALAGSNGTVNLQGGVLDVTHTSGDGLYGGKIGAAQGTTAFNFTGGTLRVIEYNAPDFGGNLGGLTQNGAGSLLDVTGNDTILRGGYTLTAGTASVGAGRTLTVASNAQLDATFSVGVSGAAIGTLAVNGGLTLGAASVLDVQGALNGATTYVIATFSPGSLTGMFGDALDATDNGYNVVYENTQILLDELDGDANHDGIVDIFDINLVSSNWDPAGPVGAFAPGNVNHDAVVDIFDVNFISSNWNNVATNGGPAHAQAVPEPSTLLLLSLGAVALVGWRRNSNRRT